MKPSRTFGRRTVGISSAKAVITSLSIAATLGGWAAIGAGGLPALASATTDASASLAPPDQGSGPLASPDQGASPFAPAPFGDRRRHRHDWPPSSGQPLSPGTSDPGQTQPPEQLAPQTPDGSQTSPAPSQPRPLARSRSSR